VGQKSRALPTGRARAKTLTVVISARFRSALAEKNAASSWKIAASARFVIPGETCERGSSVLLLDFRRKSFSPNLCNAFRDGDGGVINEWL
jgi:hypothetical protein